MRSMESEIPGLRSTIPITGLLALIINAGPAYGQSALNQTNYLLQHKDLVTAKPPPKAEKITVETDSPVTPVPQLDAQGGVFVGAIRVEGASKIPEADFSSAIEPYLGRTLAPTDLAALCHAIADVARNHGLSFASAYVSPQALTLGVLTVQLDEGVIARIQVSGTRNRRVLAILDKLTGHAPTARETEKQILLVDDIPGITVERVAYARMGEQGMLMVDIQETRVSGLLSLDNYGSSLLGPVRATAVVEFTHALVPGDKLTLQTIITPTKPKELGFVALKYDLPLDNDSTVVSGSATFGRVQPGGVLADFQIKGRSVDLEVGVKRPLLRNRKASLWISANFDFLNSDQEIVGLAIAHDRLVTASLSVIGNAELFGGRLAGDITLTRGLSVFGATRLGDFMSSRAEADAVFTKLVLSADWTGKLTPWLTMRLTAMSQMTRDPLLPAQQIGFGGPSFGRAYDFNTAVGDYGTLGSIELRHDFIKPMRGIDWVQPYVFIDGGTVDTIGSGTSATTLFSAGGGLRAGLGKFNFMIEGAAPINLAPTATNTPRINVQVSRRF